MAFLPLDAWSVVSWNFFDKLVAATIIRVRDTPVTKQLIVTPEQKMSLCPPERKHKRGILGALFQSGEQLKVIPLRSNLHSPCMRCIYWPQDALARMGVILMNVARLNCPEITGIKKTQDTAKISLMIVRKCNFSVLPET